MTVVTVGLQSWLLLATTVRRDPLSGACVRADLRELKSLRGAERQACVARRRARPGRRRAGAPSAARSTSGGYAFRGSLASSSIGRYCALGRPRRQRREHPGGVVRACRGQAAGSSSRPRPRTRNAPSRQASAPPSGSGRASAPPSCRSSATVREVPEPGPARSSTAATAASGRPVSSALLAYPGVGPSGSRCSADERGGRAPGSSCRTPARGRAAARAARRPRRRPEHGAVDDDQLGGRAAPPGTDGTCGTWSSAERGGDRRPGPRRTMRPSPAARARPRPVPGEEARDDGVDARTARTPAR